MCGDYVNVNYEIALDLGSPPRVRGLLALVSRLAALDGITPACAGTTDTMSVLCPVQMDHPRVCGDYGVDQVFQRLALWITPACAGTTHCRYRLWRAVQDHPRVCGDYHSRKYVSYQAAGSPPRVRGLRWRCMYHSRKCGITPACAGTTKALRVVVIVAGDHPRVCGDYSKLITESRVYKGSPPRVRGLHLRVDLVDLRDGITPACAGTTTRHAHV